MLSTELHVQTNLWLRKNGPKALESLLCAIVFPASAPLLVTNEDRLNTDASSGTGRPGEPFTDRASAGRFQQLRAGGMPVEAACNGKMAVLANSIPANVQDFALILLDPEGHIFSWYKGAERLYHYSTCEAIGRRLSILRPSGGEGDAEIQDEWKRAVLEGRFGNDGWHLKKDGSRFWANTITVPLIDEDGELQGFAAVVRDFSDRHTRDEKLRRSLPRMSPSPAEPAIAGIVSGGFERIPEANDTFLELAGYTRGDLTAGRLAWSDLTPKEYAELDERAHEEGLRFGACSPYKKELIRKDGTRVPVLVTMAVPSLSPFRWITFVTDLRERNRQESIEGGIAEAAHSFEDMVGSSPALKRVTGQVEIVAPTDATVLILGETGTGKELIARAIHGLSPRRNLPFITLNCAAIPTGLLESELFGYEKGAFTGALSQKLGRFEMANRGTLFLDEVGDIPLELQPKLLRALQDKAFERLGGTKTISINVRLVAATNRNLNQMVADKQFRSDLFYRLKVFPIMSPPLRDRPEDIAMLARHFTRKYAEKMNRKIERIPSETMEALVNWPWPGNVRELENFIERSVILSSGPELRAPVAELVSLKKGTAVGATLDEMERAYVLRVLQENGGGVSAAAIRAMMKKLGILRGSL